MKIELEVNQNEVRLASIREWVDSEKTGIALYEIIDGIKKCLDNSDLAKRIDAEIIKKVKDNQCIKK